MSNPEEEIELINRIVAGERDVYRLLVSRYEQQILGLLFRELGELETARELTHEAFVKAYLALPSFRRQSKFVTWLTRIALNCANEHLRHRRGRRKFLIQLQQGFVQTAGLAETANVPVNNTDRMSECQQLVALNEALCKLPTKYRDVTVLCALENKTYAEASEILNIPYGTVCSRMNTALSKLRKYLRGKQL